MATSNLNATRISARVQEGIKFLDDYDRNWRDVVRENSMPKAGHIDGKRPVTKPGKAPPKRPKPLDEFIDKDGVISRYCNSTPERALKMLRLTREKAEDLGFYFKDANPHNRLEIIEEYKLLTRLWNTAVYGRNIPVADPVEV
jgi:hypothetical protein